MNNSCQQSDTATLGCLTGSQMNPQLILRSRHCLSLDICTRMCHDECIPDILPLVFYKWCIFRAELVALRPRQHVRAATYLEKPDPSSSTIIISPLPKPEQCLPGRIMFGLSRMPSSSTLYSFSCGRGGQRWAISKQLHNRQE